ncbi:PREDICTED: uncharacterized protein LOC104804424 isoform X2 [Tarenaya hassleriana]|uniref:uncharacterized protein LOC104804424 isoform X2 n=1 Tax=Tarenaya hassleriana TaxID=28532 RepID=UPI0008FD0262|nr:PREDICTED: uncharacterized protein LOC104804424 isoform X2 [Tarenaya hassleriana]
MLSLVQGKSLLSFFILQPSDPQHIFRTLTQSLAPHVDRRSRPGTIGYLESPTLQKRADFVDTEIELQEYRRVPSKKAVETLPVAFLQILELLSQTCDLSLPELLARPFLSSLLMERLERRNGGDNPNYQVGEQYF